MDEPLNLPVQHQLDDLTRAIAALTDQVGRHGEAERRTQAETERAADALEVLQDRANKAFSGFRDGIDFAQTWAERIGTVITRVTELASEQEQLDRVTARTGLDLDQAAAAAGRFADETEAAGAASTILQAGVAVSQRELDALMRVAGSASQMLGITTQDAVRQLTQALISGSTEGLRRFTPELVELAGESRSASERIRALVDVAERTPAAMDSASDSVARFRDSVDDASRTIATNFVQEWQRLSDLGAPFRGASTDAEELNRDLEAMGRTAARVLSIVGNTLGAVGGSIAAGASGAVGLAQRALSYVGGADVTEDEAYGDGREYADFVRRRFAALGALASDGDPRTTAPVSDPRASTAQDRTTAAQRAADDARRTEQERLARRRRLGLDADDDDLAENVPTAEVTINVGGRRARSGGGGARRDPFEDRLRQENEIADALREAREAREQAEERSRKAAAEAENREAAARRDAMERARERDRQRDEATWSRSDDGLRAANDNARAQRNEERALDQRRQQLRSFTDFFEEQHARQVVAAREASEGVTSALGAVGSAYSKHLMALVTGREEMGEALQGMLADTLSKIGEESAVKAGFNLAEGIAAAATYRYDAAAQHFAAFGIYTAVAAGTGAAGAALSAPAGGASGAAPAAASPRPTDRMQGANDNAGGGETIVITNTYYAPYFGGREGTSAEAGREVQRYTGAADRRRLGRTAS